MTTDPSMMFAWIRSRKSFRQAAEQRYMKEFADACQVFGMSIEDVSGWAGEQRGSGWLQKVVNDCGNHFGHGVSVSSVAYTIVKLAATSKGVS